MTTELSRYMEDAITVQDLIDALEGFDPKAKVMFSYNFGDYWRTVVAESVCKVDTDKVVWSARHRQPKVILEDDNPDMEDKDIESVDVVMIGS